MHNLSSEEIQIVRSSISNYTKEEWELRSKSFDKPLRKRINGKHTDATELFITKDTKFS